MPYACCWPTRASTRPRTARGVLRGVPQRARRGRRAAAGRTSEPTERTAELSLSNSSMRALPDSLGRLVSLWMLCLAGYRSLPESLGQLSSLQWLSLSRCTSLSRLPESLGQASVTADAVLVRLLVADKAACVAIPAESGAAVGLDGLPVARSDSRVAACAAAADDQGLFSSPGRTRPLPSCGPRARGVARDRRHSRGRGD